MKAVRFSQVQSTSRKDEYAIIIERDFSGLPLGFVAVVRVSAARKLLLRGAGPSWAWTWSGV